MEVQKIIEGCLNKDEESEKQFYYLNAKRIFAICKRYSKDDHQAKDYMQECFQKIFTHLNKFDPDKGKIENWISRVTTNYLISQKRKKYIELQEFIDEEYTQEENSIEDELEYLNLISGKDILVALRSLSPIYADVFNLYIFENRKHKEISKLMDITESSSRSRLTRAKRLLRAELCQKILNQNKQKKSEIFLSQI